MIGLPLSGSDCALQKSKVPQQKKRSKIKQVLGPVFRRVRSPCSLLSLSFHTLAFPCCTYFHFHLLAFLCIFMFTCFLSSLLHFLSFFHFILLFLIFSLCPFFIFPFGCWVLDVGWVLGWVGWWVGCSENMERHRWAKAQRQRRRGGKMGCCIARWGQCFCPVPRSSNHEPSL